MKAEAAHMRTLDEHYRQYVEVPVDKDFRTHTHRNRLKQAMKEEYGAVAAALNRRIQDLNFQITHMSGSLQVRPALPVSLWKACLTCVSSC